MPTLTAILGWGSLLWDHRPQFDRQHGEWLVDGPTLKLEFSRISDSRLGALTLVIDPTHGAPCTIAYAMSLRADPQDVICDLRAREATVHENIGYLFLDGSREHVRDADSRGAIASWAKAKEIDVVVWTDLQPKFSEVCGEPFSVENAVAYIRTLGAPAQRKAAEYILRAPAFAQTPLRTALQDQPWFAKPEA